MFRATRRMFRKERGRENEKATVGTHEKARINRFRGEDKCKKFQRPEEEQNDKTVATNYETFSGIFTL